MIQKQFRGLPLQDVEFNTNLNLTLVKACSEE